MNKKWGHLMAKRAGEEENTKLAHGTQNGAQLLCSAYAVQKGTAPTDQFKLRGVLCFNVGN